MDPDQYSFSNALGSVGEKVAEKWLIGRFKKTNVYESVGDRYSKGHYYGDRDGK